MVGFAGIFYYKYGTYQVLGVHVTNSWRSRLWEVHIFSSSLPSCVVVVSSICLVAVISQLISPLKVRWCCNKFKLLSWRYIFILSLYRALYPLASYVMMRRRGSVRCLLLYLPWINVVCRPKIKIPAFVMMPIAHIVEWTYKLLGPYGMKVPQLTPSRIRLLSCSRSFNCSKAKDRLGYSPIVTLEVA